MQESEDSESLFSEDASFDINIQHFIKLFNENEGIILKHLPNTFLSREQINIKEKIISADTSKMIQKNKKNQTVKNETD